MVKTREYRHIMIQEASFSTGNWKNTRNTGTGKTQYDTIWRNELLGKLGYSRNA